MHSPAPRQRGLVSPLGGRLAVLAKRALLQHLKRVREGADVGPRCSPTCSLLGSTHLHETSPGIHTFHGPVYEDDAPRDAYDEDYPDDDVDEWVSVEQSSALELRQPPRRD